MNATPVRVLHASASDLDGGASRAAFRLHRALSAAGVESTMIVDRRLSNDAQVCGPSNRVVDLINRVRRKLDPLPDKLLGPRREGVRSTNWIPGFQAQRIATFAPDLVNLHWICAGLLSIGQIGRLRRPVVWTMHDMWAFCGAEHYPPSIDEDRWRNGYHRTNRGRHEGGLDTDRWIWHWKRSAWSQDISVVAPSSWLAETARGSALFSNSRTWIIPNPVPLETFRPTARRTARQQLRLPDASTLVLFGAMGGTRDPRKGWDLLQSALLLLSSQFLNVQAVIIGQDAPRVQPRIGVPLHWFGHVDDDRQLALLYSACDVTVVPSRRENLPQLATEAQAAGCPVVAFRIGGVPDAVEHKITGYLAEPFEVEDLAAGIEWVVSDEVRQLTLRAEARYRAERLWADNVIASQYLNVYQEVLAGSRPGSQR